MSKKDILQEIMEEPTILGEFRKLNLCYRVPDDEKIIHKIIHDPGPEYDDVSIFDVQTRGNIVILCTSENLENRLNKTGK